MAETTQDTTKPVAHERISAEVKSEAEAAGREVEKEKAKTEAPVEEAVQVLAQTREVLEALEQQDTAKALDVLAHLIGRLEILVSRYPQLQLLPVGQRSQVIDIHADIDSIKAAEKRAKKLLDDGEIQAARQIIRYLASEIVLITDYLPLAEFPELIKRVVPLIDAGRLDEARQALIAALNTVTSMENIVPLPVVRAQLMLQRAKQLSEEKEPNQEEILRLVEAARYQVQMAEVLGYGRIKEDYPELYQLLSELESKTKEAKGGTGELFAKLENALSAMRERLFSHRYEQK